MDDLLLNFHPTAIRASTFFDVPGKFQRPLAQIRGALHNRPDSNAIWRKLPVAGQLS